MLKPAFCVDGFMEKKILQKMNISTKIIRTDLNGKNVEISSIAERISSNIRIIQNRYCPIIVLIDRERREKTASVICIELYKELKSNGIKTNMIIGVADQMIENWILADWQIFTEYIKKNIEKPRASFEGTNGKKIIKKYFPYYQETTDGVDLFCKSRASIIKDNSKSFESFIEKIMKLNYSCYWLER